MANYRNRKLLDLAHRVHECQLKIPGVCIGHSVAGCEPAHANWSRYGKGMGVKAHDIYHAAACGSCHQELDNGRILTREQAQQIWREGFERTLLLYAQNGWIKVG